MMGAQQLWNTRAKAYWNMAIRYLRLIGNSGFLFALYLLIIIGSYYYSLLLDWLPETFPTKAFFVVITTIVLTRGSIRTFVKEGDLVFLLPMEKKLHQYFLRSIVYTFIFQAVGILFLYTILGPLFQQRLAPIAMDYMLILLLLLLAKGWNLVCAWEEQRLTKQEDRRNHSYLRFIINGVFAFFLFTEGTILFLLAISVLMVFLYVIYYQRFSSKYSIKWEHLLEIEERMVSFFYRIVNLFTDVPKLRGRMKKRGWLTFLFSSIRYEQRLTFHYLFLRSFVRASDYLGIYIRLGVIGAVFIIVLPEGILRFVVLNLFLYLSGFQLSTLWKHYATKLWVDLYPVSIVERKTSFSHILLTLLLIKAVFLALVLLMFEGFSIYWIGFLLVGFLFSYVCSKKLIFMNKNVF